MKFAGKISEADVSNVTWSVLSFYANKSGGRLISPWCSDTTVAVAIVNVGVGVGVGVNIVDGRGRRLTSAGDMIPAGVYGTSSSIETGV